MFGRPHRAWSAAFFLFAALAAAPLVAAAQQAAEPVPEAPQHQPEEASEAAVPEPDGLTLEEVVALTLRHDPQVLRAREVVTQRQGELQQSEGVFDRTLFGDLQVRFAEQSLLSQRLEEEMRRRIQLDFVSRALDRAGDEIMARLPSVGSLLLDECQPHQTLFIVTLQDGRRVTMCFFDNQLIGIVGSDVVDMLTPEQREQFRRLGIRGLASFGLIEQLFLQGFLEGLGLFIDQTQQDLLDAFADILRVLARQLRLGAAALFLQRERLGDLPDDEQFLSLNLELSHQWRFRNGSAISANVSLAGSEDHFAGKPRHPGFGGSPVPHSFNALFGFALDLPLGKGRGRVAAEAPVVAARSRLEAAELLLEHTAAESVLIAVESYWALAAAQERVALLEASLLVQDQVLDATRQLVEADQIVAADLARTSAQAAAVRQQLASARQELAEARQALIRATGLEARPGIAGPVAAEPLVPVEDLGEVASWVAAGLAERRDLAAAEAAEEAAEVLARAARANLRRQVDLTANLAYSGFHESLEDRVYDPSGYWRALTGKIAGPSYFLGLRFAIPFGNRTARGQLLQAESSLTRSEVIAAEMARQTRLEVLESHATLLQAQAQLAALQESLLRSEETLDASLERFRVGDLSLIDTLLTEEQLTQARLAALDVAQQIAALDARLRFQAGRLLVLDDPSDPASARLLAAAPQPP